MSKSFREIHVTGEGFRTLSIYRLFFARALRDIRKREADYDAEVAEWYESGPGAPRRFADLGFCQSHDFEHEFQNDPDPCIGWELSRQYNVGGEGYQFPTCIHGSSLTTDYDNICGWCEDSSTAIEQAIVDARSAFLRFNTRWEWVNDAPGDLAYDIRNDLMGWATSLFPKGA